MLIRKQPSNKKPKAVDFSPKKVNKNIHPNIFIISYWIIKFNRFYKNKILNIFNKSVDNVKNVVYNIDKEKEIKGGLKYDEEKTFN